MSERESDSEHNPLDRSRLPAQPADGYYELERKDVVGIIELYAPHGTSRCSEQLFGPAARIRRPVTATLSVTS